MAGINRSHWCVWLLRGLGLATMALFALTAFTPLWNVAGSRLSLSADLQSAEAIVVLGSGIKANGELTDESMRRALYGLQLYKQGLAPLLVFCGPSRPGNPLPPEAEIRKTLAADLGIPRDAVLVVTQVANTRDEALQTASVLASRHARSILLVTQALHIRRSRLVFERAGFQVHAAPSDDAPHAAATPQERLLLMPDVVAQAGALLYYRLRGYI